MSHAVGSYVLFVEWHAQSGAEDMVADILRKIADAAMKEEGVLAFHVARNQERPEQFTLFEIYRNQDAHAIHMETADFKHLVLERALPLLEKRERVVLQLVA